MRLRYVVEEEMMIKEYILLMGISSKLARKIKLYGKMYINNTEAKNYFVVKKGDILELEYNEAINEDIQVNTKEVEILYEDEYLMVVVKPVDLATQPTSRHQEDNLVARLINYFKGNNISSNVHIVNRLDFSTSGILLVAKNGNIHYQLTKDKIDRIQRKYLAVVKGFFEEKQGIINLPIDRIEEHNIMRQVSESGKEAITYYKVLKEYKSSNESLVELTLGTGRTHQIRVHMSYLCHPVIGDKLYGTEKDRLYLHCYQISFIHPITNERMLFEKKPDWNNYLL